MMSGLSRAVTIARHWSTKSASRVPSLRSSTSTPRIPASAAAPAASVRRATWYVDDIDQIVDELAAVGVEFVRYDEFEHDAKGITPRAGGGRIAWFQDPDGNTFAIEADI